MRKIPKAIQPGTLVKIYGDDQWHEVKEIPYPHLIKLFQYAGCFQIGHIEKYTNKHSQYSITSNI